MFFLGPPEAAPKRTRVCFFGGEAAEKTHILFCARSLKKQKHGQMPRQKLVFREFFFLIIFHISRQ